MTPIAFWLQNLTPFLFGKRLSGRPIPDISGIRFLSENMPLLPGQLYIACDEKALEALFQRPIFVGMPVFVSGAPGRPLYEYPPELELIFT